MALDTTGKVYTWGDNSYGQLGDGTTTDRILPIPILGNNNYKAIAGGFSHSMAIDFDNNLYGWGNNNKGQLGIGNFVTKTRPTIFFRNGS